MWLFNYLSFSHNEINNYLCFSILLFDHSVSQLFIFMLFNLFNIFFLNYQMNFIPFYICCSIFFIFFFSPTHQHYLNYTAILHYTAILDYFKRKRESLYVGESLPVCSDGSLLPEISTQKYAFQRRLNQPRIYFFWVYSTESTHHSPKQIYHHHHH